MRFYSKVGGENSNRHDLLLLLGGHLADAARKVSGFLGHEVPVTAESVSHIESAGGQARLVVSDLAI